MLIKCPECNKEISDKSTQCIHCGYPLIEDDTINICMINNIPCDLSQELKMINRGINMGLVIRAIREKCSMSLSDAKCLYDVINDTKKIPNEFQCEIIALTNQPNTPKCPTCSSTNIKKISTTSKIVGAATFGLFSKKARSQFQCNNCGYKW